MSQVQNVIKCSVIHFYVLSQILIEKFSFWVSCKFNEKSGVIDQLRLVDRPVDGNRRVGHPCAKAMAKCFTTFSQIINSGIRYLKIFKCCCIRNMRKYSGRYVLIWKRIFGWVGFIWRWLVFQQEKEISARMPRHWRNRKDISAK